MPKTYAMLENDLMHVLETKYALLQTPVSKRSQEHKERLRQLTSAAKKLRREMNDHPDAPKQLRLF